jgi:hypothetical protein
MNARGGTDLTRSEDMNELLQTEDKYLVDDREPEKY